MRIYGETKYSSPVVKGDDGMDKNKKYHFYDVLTGCGGMATLGQIKKAERKVCKKLNKDGYCSVNDLVDILNEECELKQSSVVDGDLYGVSRMTDRVWSYNAVRQLNKVDGKYYYVLAFTTL